MDLDDGRSSTFGTFERPVVLTLDGPPGWPVGENSAPQSFFIWLGSCIAGSSPPCSPSGGFPGWTSCSDDYCLAELGEVQLFARSDYRYLVSIREDVENPALELMFLGMTEREAMELIVPNQPVG